ncbi:MAG: hypothetical protein E3J81_06580 [Dehalococcoidia bacterium]|nr:MAG: hypothetical protein E3J81_06580 [Dehalococcoidia bacterium]
MSGSELNPKTSKGYLGQLRAFVRFFKLRHPRELSDEDIRRYLLYLMDNGFPRAAVDQAINALRFLYVEMYHRDFALKDVPRPKKERKLPVVLSRDRSFTHYANHPESQTLADDRTYVCCWPASF